MEVNDIFPFSPAFLAAYEQLKEKGGASAPGPKRWVIIHHAEHNDLDAGPGLAEAIRLTVDWFSEHLA